MGTICRATGRLFGKSSCFALRQSDGDDIWLEMDPIPLHLLDADVEIEGEQFGADLILVQGIRPATR